MQGVRAEVKKKRRSSSTAKRDFELYFSARSRTATAAFALGRLFVELASSKTLGKPAVVKRRSLRVKELPPRTPGCLSTAGRHPRWHRARCSSQTRRGGTNNGANR